MQIDKNKVIREIKKAKEYGLSYSKIAKEMGIPVSNFHMFVNGTYNMSIPKQLNVVLE